MAGLPPSRGIQSLRYARNERGIAFLTTKPDTLLLRANQFMELVLQQTKPFVVSVQLILVPIHAVVIQAVD